MLVPLHKDSKKKKKIVNVNKRIRILCVEKVAKLNQVSRINVKTALGFLPKGLKSSLWSLSVYYLLRPPLSHWDTTETLRVQDHHSGRDPTPVQPAVRPGGRALTSPSLDHLIHKMRRPGPLCYRSPEDELRQCVQTAQPADWHRGSPNKG